MKKFVSTLGLGLLLGCFGACGDDLGAPKPPDGGGTDGGVSGKDGGGSSEAGHAIVDSGNTSEVSPADVGGDDHPVPSDSGIGDSAVVDAGNLADVLIIIDQATDTRLPPVGIDGSTVDLRSAIDVTGDHPVGVDGGSVDTGSSYDVGIDSVESLDGSELSLVIPQAGESFSPPLQNASSLPSGVWYCDMGTVHWAQGEKGTGKCPICGMDLVQKS